MFARAYVEETYTRWPVIVDHRRSLDHAYAMLHGSLREHLGTSNVVRGRLPGAAQGDKLSWVGTCSSSPKER